MRVSCIVFDILVRALTHISPPEDAYQLNTHYYDYRDEYNKLHKCLEVYDYVQDTSFPIIVITTEVDE